MKIPAWVFWLGGGLSAAYLMSQECAPTRKPGRRRPSVRGLSVDQAIEIDATLPPEVRRAAPASPG